VEKEKRHLKCEKKNSFSETRDEEWQGENEKRLQNWGEIVTWTWMMRFFVVA